jgi:L-amino acid N-acyltransferase YncA
LIRKGTAADLPAIGDALADAFETDPVTRWYWRKPKRRREHLAAWFSLIAELHHLPTGEVYVAEDDGQVVGASLWAAPGKWRFSPSVERRVTWEVIPRLGLRLPLASIAMRRMERRHPADPHWYLATLGVRSSHQGRGLGSKLMFDVLSRCDREGVPAYLESSTEGSRALYERHGFRADEVLDLPRNGPQLWLMWRPHQ